MVEHRKILVSNVFLISSFTVDDQILPQTSRVAFCLSWRQDDVISEQNVLVQESTDYTRDNSGRGHQVSMSLTVPQRYRRQELSFQRKTPGEKKKGEISRYPRDKGPSLSTWSKQRLLPLSTQDNNPLLFAPHSIFYFCKVYWISPDNSADSRWLSNETDRTLPLEDISSIRRQEKFGGNS